MLQAVGVDRSTTPYEVVARQVVATQWRLHCLLVCALMSEERAALSAVRGDLWLPAESVLPPTHVLSSVK